MSSLGRQSSSLSYGPEVITFLGHEEAASVVAFSLFVDLFGSPTASTLHLSKLPVSNFSTTSTVAPLHGPEYFLVPHKSHIHHTLLFDYFQSLQTVSTPIQSLISSSVAQLQTEPAVYKTTFP